MNDHINDTSAAYLVDDKLLTSSHSREGGNPVPAGFKQTEIGQIPEDWTLSTMARITNLMTNGFVGTAKSHYTDSHDGVVYIQGYNVEENGINYHGIKRVTLEFHKKNAKSCLRTGDVLMVQTGDVGLVTIVTPELEGSNCHALIINRFKPSYDPKYFVYLFNSEHGRQRLKELETGTTMKHINVGDLLHFVVPFPKLKQEQTAIANTLSDVDALIDNLEALIAKKQAIKTATMQQLLTGRTRLPQFARRPDGSFKGTKHTELGEIPEDWNELNIGKDAVLKARIGWQALTTKEYLDSGTNYLVTGTDFDAGAVNWDSCCYVSEWRYKQDTNIQLKKGDVLITKDGTIGKVGLVRSLPAPATLNSGVFVIRPKNESFQPEYLFYVLTSRIFDLFMKGITAGSTITHLYQKDFVSFSFYAPSKEEQVEIAALLSGMEDEIKSLEHRVAKTRQLKQGMMQELLTGKTRLIQPNTGLVQTPKKHDDRKTHNWAFNEAVIISVLAKNFGSEKFPLGRKRYTKLSYLLHRHVEKQAEGYLKKAAGPYNPRTRYAGPERIARENGYIREYRSGKLSGFIAAENIAQAEQYFQNWYGSDKLKWLNQFRFKRNDELELLATVDMAIVELFSEERAVSVDAVKSFITRTKEWTPKLKKDIFSDENIAYAIEQCRTTFGSGLM